MAAEQPVALSGPGSQAQRPTPRCGQHRTSSSCTCTCASRLPLQPIACMLECTTVGVARYYSQLFRNWSACCGGACGMVWLYGAVDISPLDVVGSEAAAAHALRAEKFATGQKWCSTGKSSVSSRVHPSSCAFSAKSRAHPWRGIIMSTLVSTPKTPVIHPAQLDWANRHSVSTA